MGRLVDIEDVKDAAGVQRGDDDVLIERLISAAEVRVERWTGRRFSPEPALTGTPPADTSPAITKDIKVTSGARVRVPDLRSVVSVTYGGLGLQPDTGYVLEDSGGFTYADADGNFHDFPATHLRMYPGVGFQPNFDVVRGIAGWQPHIIITGKWGFYPCPEDVVDAVRTMVARAYKRKDANYADQVSAGVESVSLNYFRKLPQEVTDTLAYYRPPRLALV